MAASTACSFSPRCCCSNVLHVLRAPQIARVAALPARSPRVVRWGVDIRSIRHSPSECSIHRNQRRRVVPRFSVDDDDGASGNSGGYDDAGDASHSWEYASDHMAHADLHAALDEALELFSQATTISGLQVQSEMERAFSDDSAQASSADASATVTATPQPQALLGFWVEQGLSTAAAGALLDAIRERGRSYSTNQLSAKVQRLQRVLPDADIASLALKDPSLLDVDINTALLNMICLVESFPGRDIVSLLVRQPRLLWCEDLRERVPRVMSKLRQLHPSGDLAVVREIIGDNPELLFRMDYYMDAALLDYLPIEIQNMMVLTGQGLGSLYRYYNNRRTNYQAEVLRHNFPLDGN